MANVDLSTFDRLGSLEQARANFVSSLVAASDPAKAQPSYSIGGFTRNYPEYLRFLREQIAALDELVGEADTDLPEVISAID